MNDSNWELDPELSVSGFSVEDILAEFQTDDFLESVPAALDPSAPVGKVDISGAPDPAVEDSDVRVDSPSGSGKAQEEISRPLEESELPFIPNADSESEKDVSRYSRRARGLKTPSGRDLFSFLHGKKSASGNERKNGMDAMETAGDVEDSFDDSSDVPEDTEVTSAHGSRTLRDYPVYEASHSGSLGRMEQEARSYIARLQDESGAPFRRDREPSSSHSVDLDMLLSIDAGEERTAPPFPQDAEERLAEAAYSGYDDGLDYDHDTDEEYAPDADPTQLNEGGSPYSPLSEREKEIDSRFNLSGKRQREQISYGGSAVDLSPDENYVPAVQTGYSPSQWTPDYDDPLAERNPVEEPTRKKHRFLFGRTRQETVRRERADSPDLEAPFGDSTARYAEEPAKPVVTYLRSDDGEISSGGSISPDDYDSDDAEFPTEDENASSQRGDPSLYRESDLYVPPSFHEYLLSLFASFWLRLRGTARGHTAETMIDVEEDLGPELNPSEASRYYGSLLRSLKMRLRIALVLLAVLCYISLEAPVPGMLKTLPVAAIFCFGLQSAILLLALDVVTNGIMNVFRLRVGADTLAVFACLFTGLDALNVALSETSALHMPLCAVSSASVVGLLLAACLSARGLRKAIRVPAIGKHFYAVTAEEKLVPGEITLLKSLRSARGFVRRAEEAGPDEMLYNKISLPLLALSLFFTLIVMIVKRSYAEFLYILSAMLVMTVPFGAMLSFSLPFFLGSTRIFKFGAAIAGWSGLCDIGVSKNLLVTDRDLFPENAVTIDSVRIFADEDARKVISYAGSIMSASGCCSAACFVDLMRETDSPMHTVDGFEYLPGGGLKGVIDGHVVLCGSTDLMRLMNVRIPFRLTDRTTVLLAIDGILYGIFALKYEALPAIRTALINLMRSSRPPVFAVRDFNINPEMLHNTFDLATDGYDFPPFSERFKLSEPSQDTRNERISAILCNEGLAPLTSTVDTGRTMYLTVRINVWINLIASALGVLIVFIRLVGAGACPFSSLFFLALFFALLVFAVSAFVAAKR